MTYGVFLYVTLPATAPKLLDLVMPLKNNRSRNQLNILDGDYLVDGVEYYYVIYAFESVVIWSAYCIFCSTDVFYVTGVHHFKGLNSIFRLVFMYFISSFW